MSNGNNQDPAMFDAGNPCAFMKLPKCMRQISSKQLNLSICHACILGRIEGHMYAMREKVVPKEPTRR